MAALRENIDIVFLVVRSLRKADATMRARSGPNIALRSILAYLIGFTILRTMANTWIIMTILDPIVSTDDIQGLAAASALLASAPLALVTISAGDAGKSMRRLALLPLRRPARLMLDVMSPAITELPVLVMASILPAIAALPLITVSPWSWAGVWVWSCSVVAGVGTGLRGHTLAITRRFGSVRQKDRGQTRTVPVILAMLVLMVANPDPGASADGAMIRLGNRYTLQAGTVTRVADSIGIAGIPIAISALMFGFSGLLAGVAGEVPGRTTVRPKQRSDRVSAVPRLTGNWLPYSRFADARRSLRPQVAGSIIFAAIALAQSASPSLLVTIALAMTAAKVVSTVVLLMTESPSIRRLTLTAPSRPRADAGIMLASFVQAMLLTAPLYAAAVLRM